MRLWHEALIPYLPRQQLLGQHRECCALRGKGWGRKHSTVDYVFKHPYGWLVAYHYLVMDEMRNRRYDTSPEWNNIFYRGKNINERLNTSEMLRISNDFLFSQTRSELGFTIYHEHNETYLKECLDNLEAKGIHIEIGENKIMNNTNINLLVVWKDGSSKRIKNVLDYGIFKDCGTFYFTKDDRYRGYISSSDVRYFGIDYGWEVE